MPSPEPLALDFDHLNLALLPPRTRRVRATIDRDRLSSIHRQRALWYLARLEVFREECHAAGVDLEVVEGDRFLTQQGLPRPVGDARFFIQEPEHLEAYRYGAGYLHAQGYRWFRREYLPALTHNWTSTDPENQASYRDSGPALQALSGSEEPGFDRDPIYARVEERWNDLLGRCWGAPRAPDLPLTVEDAERYLKQFCEQRLPYFAATQDVVSIEPLAHSRLSFLLNVSMLRPQQVVEAILDCYQAERCSLRDAEAFIRQLSWREFVRLYFLRFGAGGLRAYERRPGFLGEPLAWTPIIALTEDDRSALLNIDHPTLPLFDRLKRAFWEHGYVHHTARFMAACFSSYLLGIDPRALYEIWRLWALDAHVETMCVNVWGMVVGGSFADPRFPPMMARQYVFQQPYLRRMALPSLLDGMTRDHWAVWNEGVRAAEARTHAYLQGEPRGEALYRQYRGLQYGRARARAYIDRGLHEPSVLEGIRSALLTH